MTFVDPYIDKDTGTLKNLLGCQTLRELKELEPQIVFANELELESVNIPRTNNLKELCLIHKQLFKGVYDWAGKVRTVDIKKNTENAEFFLLFGMVISASNYVFTELAEEEHLIGSDIAIFVQRITYYYDQLNYIHPFREGNGRAQRIFWSRVAKDVGYSIGWDLIKGDENNEACRIATEHSDRSELQKMFLKIIKPLTPD